MTQHRTLVNHDGTTREVHLGGWRRQMHDERDKEFGLKLHRGLLRLSPTTVDLRPSCSAVEDQESLGSCTANAFAALIEANELRRTLPGYVSPLDAALPSVAVGGVAISSDGKISFLTTVTPAAPTPAPTPTPTPTPAPTKLIEVSRLFEYYATRKIECSVNIDAGATIRDTIKAGAIYGIADEALWPYNIKQFAVNPPASVWAGALTHKVVSYHAIADGDLETMKSVLATGYLIAFGFQVYSAMLSQEMAKSGLLCLPKSGESLEGGHAVALCGYSDDKVMPDGSNGAFIVRNSWGTGWGQAGYFWISYLYLKNTRLASDYWVVLSRPIG